MQGVDQILVVDDDGDFVLLLRMAFEYAGFEGGIHVAPDGDRAIEYLNDQSGLNEDIANPQPSLVLLDLRLPRLPGVAVLRWIRQQPELVALPVILMTGIETDVEEQLVEEFGATNWFVKPLGFAQLVETAHDLCASRLTASHQLGPAFH